MVVKSIFSVQEGVVAVEVHQNKEISEGGKNEGKKRVGSAIHQRRTNRGNVNIKKRERGGVVL